MQQNKEARDGRQIKLEETTRLKDVQVIAQFWIL